MFNRYNFEVAFYDEVESHREWDDDLFNYPFAERKTVIDSFTVTVAEELSGYDFISQEIKLKIADVCQEGMEKNQIGAIFA